MNKVIERGTWTEMLEKVKEQWNDLLEDREDKQKWKDTFQKVALYNFKDKA